MVFQVSSVYQTMRISTLSGMIPFFDFSVVEKISVDAAKHNFVSMKVDHMRGVVAFCKTVCFHLVFFITNIFYEEDSSLASDDGSDSIFGLFRCGYKFFFCRNNSITCDMNIILKSLEFLLLLAQLSNVNSTCSFCIAES